MWKKPFLERFELKALLSKGLEPGRGQIQKNRQEEEADVDVLNDWLLRSPARAEFFLKHSDFWAFVPSGTCKCHRAPTTRHIQ